MLTTCFVSYQAHKSPGPAPEAQRMLAQRFTGCYETLGRLGFVTTARPGYRGALWAGSPGHKHRRMSLGLQPLPSQYPKNVMAD